ncbi:Sperm flagellar protein 1 [Chytridiales sp. JEL 0842]|nr:Sperm flagellar protein 1 [Chytridiales sp. JEL 0842]
MQQQLTEDEISSLLAWIDEIPLSRPKRNLTRDFSDGVAAAEVVHHFTPKLVELHNYSPANAVSQKLYNWNTLNQKVFKKLGYTAPQELISSIVSNKPGHVEYLLYELRKHIEAYLLARPRVRGGVSPESSYGTSPVGGQQQQQRKGAPQQTQPMQQMMNNGTLPALPHMEMGGVGGDFGGMNAAGVGVDGVAHAQGGMVANQQQQQFGGNKAADLAAKDIMIRELQDTIQILQLKVNKLEQLLVLKDKRIDELNRSKAQ